MPGTRSRSKEKKGPHVSLWRFLIEAIALAAAIWLLSAQGGPLSRSESPAGVVGGAILRLTVTWACATGFVLWTYLATSRDRFSDLLRAAAKSAVYAVWLVPGMLLVAPPASPWAVLAGILLIANAVRLVVANPPPHRHARLRRAWRMPHRLFSNARLQRGSVTKETFPAIVGTLALQAALVALWAGYAQFGAVLVGLGFAGITWTSVVRGAFRLGKRIHPFHSMVGVLIAVLFTISLSVVRVQLEPGGAGDAEVAAGLLSATREGFQRLVGAYEVLPPPAPKPRPPTVTRVVAPPVELDKLGKDGMPGLVLRPQGGSIAQSVNIPPTYKFLISLSPSKPLSIPFTGEYRLFRESSGDLPPGSFIRSGAPIDSVYVTTNGGPMQTEAYQPFDPPVEFGTCGKVLVTLQSGELFPASASLLLVGDKSVPEIGPEIFGLSTAEEETLSFTVPDSPGGLLVKGLRIIFRRNPMEASHRTPVAQTSFSCLEVIAGVAILRANSDFASAGRSQSVFQKMRHAAWQLPCAEPSHRTPLRWTAFATRRPPLLLIVSQVL